MDQYPDSVCSEPCNIGEAKQMPPQEPCCWLCIPCSTYDIVRADSDGQEYCDECPLGEEPNVFRNECRTIDVSFMSYSSPWAVSAMSVALAGMVAAIIVGTVFTKFNNTPVVKAAGRELSFYLLAGILMSFFSTFVMVAPPDDVTCGLTRIMLGLCYTMVYGSILTKTNRIARIFHGGSGSPKKAKYTSPKSQILIVNMLLCPQLLVLIGWLAAQPPTTTYVYPRQSENVMVCSGSMNADYIIPLVYPLVLLVLSTYYAFKTRKTPDGFNESRLVAFTSYTTLVLWIAFLPAYFGTTDSSMKIFIMCIALSLTGFVVLGCLFAPKVMYSYIP